MSSSTPSISARLPGLIAGPGCVVIGGCVLWQVAPPPLSLTYLLAVSLTLGGALATSLSWCLNHGPVFNTLRWLSINALVLAALLGLVEGTCRAARIDFTKLGGQHAKDPRDSYPIWAQMPDKPLDEVFFQRRGPAHWTGQPLRAFEVARMGTDNAFVKEPTVTIDYDADGFRNPPDLKDWDIAIVGDSFTEIGYLPHEQLTSTLIGKASGLRVKNLGVADTGLLTYARYLKRYGAAPSCKHVVFVMYEGNDVQDTDDELLALERYQASGQRDYRQAGPQHSFIKACVQIVSLMRHKPFPQSYQNAWFKTGHTELPVTICVQLPRTPATMSAHEHTALEAGIAACVQEAAALHLDPLLVYVPSNNRLYHGLLRFAGQLPDEVKQRDATFTTHVDGVTPNIQCTDLPEWVAELCAKHHLPFLDATPGLRLAAERGQHLHNRILDNHLNAEGCRLLAEIIAGAIQAKPSNL